MNIYSNSFQNGREIPATYTADGDVDYNPHLEFSNVPSEAVCLAVIVEDKDVVPAYVHWVVWNIDPSVTEIPAGTVPKGAVVGRNSGQINGYRGPNPPVGETHHYHFQVYALSDMPDFLTNYSTARDLRAEMSGYIVAQANIIGTYTRD